ncbi:LysE family translocator [Rhodoferax saidenbachensis]|uniref:Threonine/homoserine/homoserine lactone efflux protein n=1 Tax=Rhodoferax saidenbachensis TaxID=1484693 RepID=A0ABU1ZJ05_9BURK|nr:LysE family translocator [Rhodoferax saidenbachensis]MDR7305527.1 threonine/homoserine/homoserine lactone efflux protein [Rhodoferax saidenbachensis]
MAATSLLPLALFVLTSTLTPGGATTLATASGAQFGFRRSLPLLAGLSTGLATLACIAATGLSGLMLAVPSLQLAMKLAGTAYLFWLAWKIGRSGPPHLQTQLATPLGFLAGAGMLWMNPKAWAMTTGAGASFAGLAHHPAQLVTLLGAAFGLAAIVSLTIWCWTGLVLSQLLRTAAQWHTVNAILGALLAASVVPMWLQ